MTTADRLARAAVIALVAVPLVIGAAAFGVETVNIQAGWMQHHLPMWVFWLYAATSAASPIAGAAVIARWWLARRAQRRCASAALAEEQATVLIASAALLAPLWCIALAGRVFFAAGGNR